MSTLSVLQLAIDVAERQRDAANLALAQAEQLQLSAQAQFDQLVSYARETEHRWQLQGQSATTTPELMRHHYQFLGRLEHAITMQQDVLVERRAGVDAALAERRAIDLRLASLEKMCEKRRAEAMQRQWRKEQQEVDEIAALQHRNASNPHFGGRY